MHLFAQQRSQVCSACEGRMFDASSVQPKSGLCGKITVYSSYSNLMHVHDLIPRYGFTLWHCTWTCQSVSVQVNGWCPRSALASLAGCENECQEESESRGAFGSMTHHDPSSGISMKFDQAFHNNYFTIFHIYFTVCNAHPLHGNGSTATVPRGSCDARVGGWMCSTAADGGDWRRRFAQGTCFWFRIDEILGGIHDWKL